MVLFYAADKGDRGARLAETVAAAVPKGDLKSYRTLRGLTRALRRPGRNAGIAVLTAADPAELGQFLDLRELLLDLRIILVLPDDHPDSVAAGHLLRPRFMTQRDRDLAEIAAVLGRMVQQGHAETAPGN